MLLVVINPVTTEKYIADIYHLRELNRMASREASEWLPTALK